MIVIPNNKICSKCKETKEISEFSLVHPAKLNGKIRPDCKACVRLRARTWIANNKQRFYEKAKALRIKAVGRTKEWIRIYLIDHPCVDCGEHDPDVLEFDHVRGIKVCDMSKMVNGGYRTWRLEAEAAKCEIRCANCHRCITKKRRLLLADVVQR